MHESTPSTAQSLTAQPSTSPFFAKPFIDCHESPFDMNRVNSKTPSNHYAALLKVVGAFDSVK